MSRVKASSAAASAQLRTAKGAAERFAFDLKQNDDDERNRNNDLDDIKIRTQSAPSELKVKPL
jgi:hypothetical protein